MIVNKDGSMFVQWNCEHTQYPSVIELPLEHYLKLVDESSTLTELRASIIKEAQFTQHRVRKATA